MTATRVNLSGNDSFRPVRRFRGCSNMPTAAMNATNPPTSVFPAAASRAAM